MSLYSRESHYLNKMGVKELNRAFFTHYTVIVYLTLATISAFAAVYYSNDILRQGLAVLAATISFPLLWYITHRWILHGQWLYKFKYTAALWKRIHYDHHQDPYHLEVLFGALRTTIPPIALIMMPLGYAIDGWGGAAASFSTTCLVTCFNEYCHCIQHLNFKPKQQWLKHIKEQHLMHHFQDENGNYGITNYFWDKLFNTYYVRKARKKKSPTVHNLGYTPEIAHAYPWVAELSGGVDNRSPRERRTNKPINNN